jgi:hypothetical protein
MPSPKRRTSKKTTDPSSWIKKKSPSAATKKNHPIDATIDGRNNARYKYGLAMRQIQGQRPTLRNRHSYASKHFPLSLGNIYPDNDDLIPYTRHRTPPVKTYKNLYPYQDGKISYYQRTPPPKTYNHLYPEDMDFSSKNPYYISPSGYYSAKEYPYSDDDDDDDDYYSVRSSDGYDEIEDDWNNNQNWMRWNK